MPAGAYVDDVTVVVTLAGSTAYVSVDVAAGGAAAALGVSLRDATGAVVASNSTAAPGNVATLILAVANANLWWPFLMSASPAYLYTLEVTATDGAGAVDTYPLRVGLRTVVLAGTSLLINGVPLYMRGFGKHEDAAIRGKGMDQPTILKDSYLLQWFGANSFRTSHYPYSDEIMDAADAFGMVVIDESPGVGLEEQNLALNETLAHHLVVEAEHVRRDKNRASVVMWSVANEPESSTPPAAPYFAAVIAQVRAADPSRPVMFVCDQDFAGDLAMPFADVIALTRYYALYE
jgi:beta-glucuronidase